MVFNWKRGPNPLTAKQEAEEVAEALPISIGEDPEPSIPAAKAQAILEAVAAAQPILEQKPEPPKPEPPKAAAKLEPRKSGKMSPPVSAVSPGTAEAMRQQFAEVQRTFATRLDEEVKSLNTAFEKSLGEMTEKMRSLSDSVTEKEAKIAKQEQEILKLRTALKKVIDEAFDIVKDSEPPK